MLDQRFAAMDEKFELLLSEIRLLRQEMHAGFAAMREEMKAGFAVLHQEMAGLRTEVLGVHRRMTTMLAAELVAVIALLGILVLRL